MSEPTQPGPPPGRDDQPQPQPQYETYGGESFFEQPGVTQQIPIPVAVQNARRKKTLWLVGAIVAVLLVGGVVTTIVLTSGPSSATASPAPASSTPTPGKHGKAAKGTKHKHAAGGALAAGDSELQGSLTSVDSGKVTITPDGLSPITVNTSDTTKVSGTNASSLSDLKSGQQVTVVIKSGTAVTIRINKGS
jgi:hypothetical protein